MLKNETARRRILRRLTNLKYYPATSDPMKIREEIIEIVVNAYEQERSKPCSQNKK